MSIAERVDVAAGELVLKDKFTFSDSSVFRKSLNEMVARKITSLIINLAELQFMDSSGLGMLMVAHKECEKNGISLALRQPKGNVRSLLEMTKSYERFRIIE